MTDTQKERPILFSGPMVRAILEGRKTQTRRVIEKTSMVEFVDIRTSLGYPASEGFLWAGFGNPHDPVYIKCRYGMPSDRLWVRETCYICTANPDGSPLCEPPVIYRADGATKSESYPHVRTPRFMPRWASRITLEIVNVRVERLQEISEDDAKSEGIFPTLDIDPGDGWTFVMTNTGPVSYRKSFSKLWDSINEKRGYSWESNPWVWVIKFIRTKEAPND